MPWYLHFHCVALDGVFASAPVGGVVFHPATGIDGKAITAVQAKVRRRLLHSFVHRGLLAVDDARNVAQWGHGGGFSVGATVRIEAADRPGLERLLRYCARPPFAHSIPNACSTRGASPVRAAAAHCS